MDLENSINRLSNFVKKNWLSITILFISSAIFIWYLLFCCDDQDPELPEARKPSKQMYLLAWIVLSILALIISFILANFIKPSRI